MTAQVEQFAARAPVRAADLADRDARNRLSGPALRTFLRIADRWELNEAQRRSMLGFPARSTFYHWKDQAQQGKALSLSLDTLLRISAVLGIHKALRIVFPDNEQWLQAPNSGPLFGGQAPLDLMASGSQDGLMLVRRYLDALRGGAFGAPDADEQPLDIEQISGL